MLHGRGATAESILSLASELDAPDFAYLAPQAGGNSWWPQSFLAPIASNEPGISSAMQAVRDVLRHTEDAGIPAQRTLLLGFSQGACGSMSVTECPLLARRMEAHIPEGPAPTTAMRMFS